ncbi:MAG TPA: hypothetical protein VMR46_00125 [Candidatus Paceibacterota bacterium]|nr:hypothetical protein [Candidatus Paceibacterota bacterium]
MFLSWKFNEEKEPRGWVERFTNGTGPDTKKEIQRRRHLLENERPPYRVYTVEWMDTDATIWTIEKWYVKEVTLAYILKKNGEPITGGGTIHLPRFVYKYPDGKTGEVIMETYALIPSWLEIEPFKGQTMIWGLRTDGTRRDAGNICENFLCQEVAKDDNLHPVVRLG